MAPAIRPHAGAGQAPRFLTRSCTNAAGTLDYKLFLPSACAQRAMPLVVMLHGCKQNADDFAIGTRMNELAEETGFLVAYPAQTPRANGFRCWNWFREANQQRDRGEPSLIADITRDVIDTYRVDRSRVYVAGLSAGACMAHIMGSAYPELFAAVGVHSGLPSAGAYDLYSAIDAMRNGAQRPDGPADAHAAQLPTIVFHGDMDKTVHPNNGDLVLARSASIAGGGLSPGAEIQVEHRLVPGGHAYTRTVYLDRAGRPSAEQWLVHGASHAWSGGSAAGSFTDPQGPDATRAMLDFFLAHTHR
jgi:poly(hydroxyalkanoate) depolymerase family esterase